MVFTLGNLFVFQIRMFVKKREQANGNLIVTWKSIIGLRPFADLNFTSVCIKSDFDFRITVMQKTRTKGNENFLHQN